MTELNSAESLTPQPTQPPRSQRTLRLSVALAAVIAILLLSALLYRTVTGRLPFTRAPFNGIVMQSPERAANFVLTTDDGTPAGLYDFKDQVVLLYFGYTYCPDVCPATLAELKAAYNALTPRQQEKVQVILISVDPERDTPEKLREYLDFFHEDFMGMTGTEDELLAATTPLGIFFRKHEGSAASGYLVDHTASVAVIDRDGYLRLMYPFNTRGADIASDLRRLVR